MTGLADYSGSSTNES